MEKEDKQTVKCTVCQLPAVTIATTLAACQHTRLFSFSPGGQKCGVCLVRLRPRCGQGWVSAEAPGESLPDFSGSGAALQRPAPSDINPTPLRRPLCSHPPISRSFLHLQSPFCRKRWHSRFQRFGRGQLGGRFPAQQARQIVTDVRCCD